MRADTAPEVGPLGRSSEGQPQQWCIPRPSS